ncbi:MAG: hypothetical protein QM610_14690 [Chitinophagaceae bacterium]
MPVKSQERWTTRLTDFFLDLLPPSLRDTLLSAKRFHFFKGKATSSEKLLIQLVDGRDYHGGLTDRLKGIVSAYGVAQLKGRTFKIHHTSPFQLSDYLAPNAVDWAIVDEANISKNFFQARLFHFRKGDGQKGVRRIRNVGNILQMHCYCKGELYQLLETSDGWGTEYRRLFKPVADLQQRIDVHKAIIGAPYNAAVFRFQNLLGDFAEYHYQKTDAERQRQLMEKCKNVLLQLQRDNIGKKMLVTSDSSRFLQYVTGLPDIFSFPAKVVHLDWTNNASYETYLKSFLDFYLVAGADKVFSIGTVGMYKSDFPKYAAMVNGVPFVRVVVED